MVYGLFCVLCVCSRAFKTVCSVVMYGLMLYGSDCLWVFVFVPVA